MRPRIASAEAEARRIGRIVATIETGIHSIACEHREWPCYAVAPKFRVGKSCASCQKRERADRALKKLVAEIDGGRKRGGRS